MRKNKKIVYDHGELQRKQLQDAMKKAAKTDDGKSRYSDQTIVTAIQDFFDGRDINPIISLKTYNRYRHHGNISQKYGSQLFEFFSQGPEKFRFLDQNPTSGNATISDDYIVNGLLEKFSTPGKGFPYNHINSMAHTYELYRKSWVDQNSSEFFLRSHMEIIKQGSIYIFTEKQKFEASGEKIDEVDKGYIIPYSTNFYVLSNSSHCMKFYDFHYFSPEPGNDTVVNDLRGNMIAVAGKGPHPGFKIYARRVDHEVKIGRFEVKNSRQILIIKKYLNI